MSAHDYIEVSGRRWCVNCDLFQKRGRSGWYPTLSPHCQRTTPRAQALDDIELFNERYRQDQVRHEEEKNQDTPHPEGTR